MKRLLLLATIALLTACASTAPTNGTPDPDSDPDPDPPLVVTIRDYYGANGNRTLVLVDIISNQEATLTMNALCNLSHTSQPGFTLIGYEGTIRVETQGSNRDLHWSNMGAPDATANRISCNTLEGITSDGETVPITLR